MKKTVQVVFTFEAKDQADAQHQLDELTNHGDGTGNARLDYITVDGEAVDEEWDFALTGKSVWRES
jgi:hypothetical protein